MILFVVGFFGFVLMTLIFAGLFGLLLICFLSLKWSLMISLGVLCLISLLILGILAVIISRLSITDTI